LIAHPTVLPELHVTFMTLFENMPEGLAHAEIGFRGGWHARDRLQMFPYRV
jgi:hypothetical protein